ncbi:MAG: cytochrome ubiquinol oxidase subunit I [Francisellaceae bacterium]
MLPSLMSVDFARWQFGLTASFHFLFVPLTLGLTWVLFTMELMYVRTGKQVYKDMVKFWGKLLGINFALGVLTGLTMEFEFGTNWAYFSQSVGDVFGTPLAIEGLAAFMLESTFVGLFFFGWDKLSKKQHLASTFCLAIGSSFSALLILVANGFMQHPVGGEFVASTMRMQTTNLGDLFLNDMGQVGFAHVVTAGYTTAAIFVIGISAYYLMKKRDIAFAKRSMSVGIGFGFVASLMVIYLGDANGLGTFKTQPLKLASIEAEWETEQPPANFNLVALPQQEAQKNILTLQIPKVLGVLVTHSLETEIPGIKTILYGQLNKDGSRNPDIAYYVNRDSGFTAEVSPQDIAANPQTYKAVPAMTQMIHRGALAYADLLKWREAGHPGDKPEGRQYPYYNNPNYREYMGYGKLLVQPAHNKFAKVDEPMSSKLYQAAKDKQLIIKTATDAGPDVASIFWTFRVMVGIGFLMFFMIAIGLILLIKNTLWQHRWWLFLMICIIPGPFIASICGWFVAEHGRQPFTVYGQLPTSLSSSSLTGADVATSLIIFVGLDLTLWIIMLFLMVKYARLGPSSLGTGRYHFEKLNKNG